MCKSGAALYPSVFSDDLAEQQQSGSKSLPVCGGFFQRGDFYELSCNCAGNGNNSDAAGIVEGKKLEDSEILFALYSAKWGIHGSVSSLKDEYHKDRGVVHARCRWHY